MKKALMSWLLACFMAGCQSKESSIPLFEARQDKLLSVTLKARDKADLKLWESCHTRNVWFDVKDGRGKSMPYILGCIFWSDSPEANHSRRDSNEIKVLVRKDKDAFLMGKHDALMLGRRIEKPGTYLLEFHVDCYDRDHRLLYSSETEKIRCHISADAFLNVKPAAEVSEITLWASRER